LADWYILVYLGVLVAENKKKEAPKIENLLLRLIELLYFKLWPVSGFYDTDGWSGRVSNLPSCGKR